MLFTFGYRSAVRYPNVNVIVDNDISNIHKEILAKNNLSEKKQVFTLYII